MALHDLAGARGNGFRSLDTRILSVLGATLAFVPSGADARRSQQIDDVSSFRRPVLPAGADTNSWIAYYNYGVAHLRNSPEDAEAGFVWATRIDPTRSQPLYARWITFWRRNMGLYKKYLKHDRRVLESPLILRVDSFYVRAELRNPFTPRDLDLILQERLAWTTSNWADDPYTQGFVNYAARNYAKAAYYFEQLVTKDPVESSDVRRLLALCYIATHRLDQAVEQTVAVLAEQRRRSATVTDRVYQSQEVLLFGLGALHRILGDTAAARQDLSQSLTENIAFFPAHAELADMALDAGDTAQAVAEYTQAVELAPDDGVLHYRYARLLSTVGRLADAESELRRAIQLEPFFAPPYLGLALVLETRGNAAEAAEQYRGYLARTHRGDPRIEMARARLAVLAP